MFTLREIGTIFEVRCPCGCQFTVDAVGRVNTEASIKPAEEEFEMEDPINSEVICPCCRRNNFIFLFKHAIIRKEHPLYRKLFEDYRARISELAKWSKS